MRSMLALSAACLGLMAIISLWGHGAIPEGAAVPMHWDVSGVVDRTGGRAEALLAVPGMALFITVVLSFVGRSRALRAGGTRRVLHVAWAGNLLLLLGLHAFLVWNGARGSGAQPVLVLYGACALLLLIGNALGKTRRNRFVGLRTPWSLRSEDAWVASNRATGWGLSATAVLAAAGLAFGGPGAGALILLAGVAATMIVGTVISWQVARRGAA